jgi:hypothetical protein
MKIEIKYFIKKFFIQWKKLEKNALKIEKNEKRCENGIEKNLNFILNFFY